MSIGTLRENSLHAAIKAWYASPDDQFEARLDSYHIDLLTSNKQVIEIQTQSFSHIKRKLYTLVENYPIQLVYPIARDRWIVRLDQVSGQVLSRRRSPLKGQWNQVFQELVSFPELLGHSNFTLELLLTQEEEVLIRVPEAQPGKKPPRASWRRKGWMVYDRRLLDIIDRRILSRPSDLLGLLPDGLPSPFTARLLARFLHKPPRLASKMIYCLKKNDLVLVDSTRGRASQYQLIGKSSEGKAN